MTDPGSDSELESIDLAMWTRRPVTPNPVTPQAPDTPIKVTNSPEENSKLLQLFAANSPGGQKSSCDSVGGTQLMSAAGEDSHNTEDDSNRDTGNAEKTILQTIISAEDQYQPLEIKFIEGSNELETFPAYLYAMLNQYCHMIQYNYPALIKQRWTWPEALHRTYPGCQTWFEAPNTKERLLAARFSYGEKAQGQIIVVQQSCNGTGNFNNGKAVMIAYPESDARQITCDERNLSMYKWEAWSPFDSQQASLWVWRCIKNRLKSQNQGNKKTKKKDLKLSSQPDKSPSAELTVWDLRPPVTPIEDIDIVGPKQSPKRAEISREETESAVKRPRRSSIRIMNKQLRAASADLAKSQAKSLAKTPASKKLRTKESDSNPVKLHCRECNTGSFKTHWALYTHLSNSHGIVIGRHTALEEYCNKSVPDNRKEDSVTEERPQSDRPNTNTRSPVTPTPQPKPFTKTSNDLPTPPPSATFSATELPTNITSTSTTAPIFVFTTPTSTLSPPRTRPVSTITTAEKLFVHALVAGTAQTDTLILRTSINDGPAMRVVRGDEEDFTQLMTNIDLAQRKEQGRARERQVVVSVRAEELVL